MIDTDRLWEILTDEGLDADWMEDQTEIVVPCNLCADDRQRLYISADTGQWLCFHCDSRGSLLDFFTQVLEWSGHDAFDAVRKIAREEHEAQHYSPVTSHTEESLPDSIKLPLHFRPIDERTPDAFLRYLEQRHITLGLAKSRQFGYAVGGDFQGRIIVPVENKVNGWPHVYSFVARTILKNCPRCQLDLGDCVCLHPYRKVLNADPSHPSLTLYNLDWVKQSASKRVVVTEGVFDALRLPDEGVALFRSAISPAQTELLVQLHGAGKEIILCLDGDEAGRKGTRSIAEALLSNFVPLRVASLPDGVDPGAADMFLLADTINRAEEARW